MTVVLKSSNDDGMAKTVKKVPAKSAPKANAKAKKPAKAVKKEAKPTKKPAIKAVPAKATADAKQPKAAVVKTPPAKAVAKTPAEPKKTGMFDKLLTKMGVKSTPTDKPAKKSKAAKAPKTRRDEDEFLPEPEDGGGGEDLPDLEEFDETEEAQAEEEIADDSDNDTEDEAPAPHDDEVFLTDAEGRRYCKVKECDQVSAVDGYCRFHYLLLWKRIQVRRKILIDGKLERYVEELTARYPDKFLEMIRRDLKTEKDFQTAIAELEIDESANEGEFEDEAQTYIDEVRGVTETGLSDEEEF